MCSWNGNQRVLRQRISGGLSACALTALFVFYAISAWEGTSNQATQSYSTQNSQATSRQQIDESSGWYWLTHDATGFFTLGLVFVGLGQAGLFFWQLRLMREGLRDTKEAADAAKETAEATTASVSLSRVCAPFLYDWTEFELKNWSKGEIEVLGPTQQAHSTFIYPRGFWDQHYSAIADKTTDFFVFGRIDYVDTFGDRHYTDYRYRLAMDADGLKDEMVLVIDSGTGNGAT